MWKSFPKVFGFVIVTTLVLLLRRLPLVHFAAQGGDGKSARDRRRLRRGRRHISIRLAARAGRSGKAVLLDTARSAADDILLELRTVHGLRIVSIVSHPRQFTCTATTIVQRSRGLAAVGPVITGAGLIMTVVFGAFVSAEPAGIENDRRRPVRRGAGRCQRNPGIRRPRLHEHCGPLELVSGNRRRTPQLRMSASPRVSHASRGCSRRAGGAA